jgi:hypothetical protein
MGAGFGWGIAYGAAAVSSRMCLFFRSWGSGRMARCFSKLLRRSMPSRTGEMGVSSMALVDMAAVSRNVCWLWGQEGL